GNWEGFDLTAKDEAAEFHIEITDIMNDVSNEHINAKIAVAAPRGHAKSSYLSKDFPIHELVYRRRKYILIISETPRVAKGNLDWIRDQIKYNKKLRQDFGELLSPRDKANIQDNNEGFIAWEKTATIEIKSHCSNQLRLAERYVGEIGITRGPT